MTTPEHEASIDTLNVDRRTFLAGSAAAGAAVGLEGILAARRAPAYAQGTRLNIVRWVDFIPACDVVAVAVSSAMEKVCKFGVVLRKSGLNESRLTNQSFAFA